MRKCLLNYNHRLSRLLGLYDERPKTEKHHALAFLMKNLAMPSGSSPFLFRPFVGRGGDSSLLPCFEDFETDFAEKFDIGTLTSLARSCAK